ncbi:PREDICTED: putative leucine-rich repeat-containing protein DDB_G0290503 [Polistes dominula]|uniref:Leucine-rich repeat-containing protein DDB_G0290503 n=1 Tax=Polistes dominula TaxID=743375 RepID=A0ABM1J754_POLDO|nr:PREDICTED: putative leucine-rich repeat-containing protein DDB_G0290503 [Polistes dominula]
MIFPNELNTYLRDRIRDLTAENGCLRRTLEETEEKLRITEKNIIKSQLPKINLDKSNEMAIATTTTINITELSKKCKEQSAEIEILKTKCKHLEDNLASKIVELNNLKHEITNLTNKSTESDNSTGDVRSLSKDNEDKMKILTDKLQQVKTKLYESKNAYTSLKQEFNKAQKLLSSEVGDNVTVTGLSSQLGGWRGRAEQIRILQQKIVELQTKLSEYDGNLKGSFVSLERKNLANLRNAEKERRQQIENSAKELRQAEVSLETYKRKLEASKARIKVLENELNVSKANVTLLNEKRTHDDHLIETLNNRLKSVENKYQEREIDIKNKEDKIERECINVKNDLQAAQIQIDRLTRKLDEREIEIDKLRNGLIIPEDQKSQRVITHTEDRNVINNYRTSSTNMITNLNEPNEYVTIAIAAEAERERLLELVIVLNRRLDKERNDANSLAESLRNERYKLAKLELKLRKLENERTGMSKVDSGCYRMKNCKSTSGLKTNDEFANAEQIRFKLELLEEECLALKARLNTVQQDKASDLETYKRMLDQARKTFQEACKNKPVTTPATRSTITV